MSPLTADERSPILARSGQTLTIHLIFNTNDALRDAYPIRRLQHLALTALRQALEPLGVAVEYENRPLDDRQLFTVEIVREETP